MPRSRFKGDPVQSGIFSIVTTTADYVMSEDDEVVLADGTANTVTVSLPTMSSTTNSGRELAYTIKAMNVTFQVDVDTPGAETIDGGATVVLAAQYDAITVISDGSNWHIISVKHVKT